MASEEIERLTQLIREQHAQYIARAEEDDARAARVEEAYAVLRSLLKKAGISE